MARLVSMANCGALALALTASAAPAQQPAQPSTAQSPDTAQQQATPETPPSAPAAVPRQSQPEAAQSATPEPVAAGAITEEELKQLLVGKPLYLRGGYLDNALTFSEHGALIGRSAQGSYTLSAVQIEKVRLSKHKVELEGARYGLHFLGALPYEDPTKAVDRVKITPRKKVLKITIDRELVVTPKKKKEKKDSGEEWTRKGPAADSSIQPGIPASSQPGAQSELSEADQAKAEMAAAPAAERPSDPQSVTTTTSPAHATRVLKEALDNVFAQGFDTRMMAAMPEFWKLYYQAAAAKSDYRPSDPSVLRQNTVDRKARLLSTFEPDSNEYAQANGVAGMALYHVVIGADSKPAEIAVARPIGFGLDENAVEAIRKARFEPALKDGKPVPVLLDLVVEFRIFSKRTATRAETAAKTGEAAQPVRPALPGPYSVPHP
jgi:TonB family protein